MLRMARRITSTTFVAKKIYQPAVKTLSTTPQQTDETLNGKEKFQNYLVQVHMKLTAALQNKDRTKAYEAALLLRSYDHSNSPDSLKEMGNKIFSEFPEEAMMFYKMAKNKGSQNFGLSMRMGWYYLSTKNYAPKEAARIFQEATRQTLEHRGRALAYNGLSAAKLALATLSRSQDAFYQYKKEAISAAESAMIFAENSRVLCESWQALCEIYFQVSFGRTLSFQVTEGLPVDITATLVKAAREKENQNWHNLALVSDLGKMRGLPMPSVKSAEENKEENGLRGKR